MELVSQLLVVEMLLITAATATLATTQAKNGCQYHCGDYEIPYPFGTTPACYLNEDFLITCNQTYNPPKPFLRKTLYPVTHISVEGQLHVLSTVAKDCHGDGVTPGNLESWFNLKKFSISNTENKFTVIGCNSYAFMRGWKSGNSFVTGCISLCDDISVVENGSCTGGGCCQIDIPRGLQHINFTAYSFDDEDNVSKFNNKCTYAFIFANSQFNFSSTYLYNLPDDNFPIVLDWTITGDDNCTEGSNKSANACNEKAMCYVRKDQQNSGYRCKCKDGYQGNPYLSHGCLDINECENSTLNDCVYGHFCDNTEGSFRCRCRKGYHGDGKRGEEGCFSNQFSVTVIVPGIGILFLVLLCSSSCFYLMWKKRKLIKLKEKFFQQNGGLLLQEELAKCTGCSDTAKIITAKELQKATNNYARDRIIGRGGFGTVYKGFLTEKDNTPIAIKKSKVVNKSQIEQFINEVVVLSQINHRNVVRLLGCCLETEVPLLVYEFVSNGTLFEHIHGRDKTSTISWETRLKIAAETAEVLSYLHSAASTPIIHRDIKSSNILLDDNYNAKVSDFGASKLVPTDVTQLSTMVQGTLGYLDPEYLQTSQLTEKSDVYSFGVVLMELMTGKKPILLDRPEEERNLVVYFLSLFKEGCLFEIIDSHIMNDGNKEQLKAVAKLATMCVTLNREERPTMREVAMELERLIMMHH